MFYHDIWSANTEQRRPRWVVRERSPGEFVDLNPRSRSGLTLGHSSSCVSARVACSGPAPSTCYRCQDGSITCSLRSPPRGQSAQQSDTSHHEMSGSEWQKEIEHHYQDSHQSIGNPSEASKHTARQLLTISVQSA